MDNTNRTLFIKNLAYSLDEEKLKELIVAEFAKAAEDGTVDHVIEIADDEEKNKSVFILKDKNNLRPGRNGDMEPRSKGMAFVTLKNPDDVESAISILNGKEFDARPIGVERKRESTGERRPFNRDGGRERNMSSFDDAGESDYARAA